jgi:biopolymer transport protein ExbB
MLELLQVPYVAVLDLVDQGGPFVFLIFVSGVVMWTLVLERTWYFWKVLPNEADALFEVWNTRADHLSWFALAIRRMMISRLNSAMNTNLLVMRVLVPMAPLLGLIGTVSGMLEVFDSMALRGSADARTMASGVSHAMICTMSGLAVSITGLFPVYHFTRKANAETELLNDRFRI